MSNMDWGVAIFLGLVVFIILWTDWDEGHHG